MTKADHVACWLDGAELNWREVSAMLAAGTYVPCLFWAHLTIEKLAKALWVKENAGNPTAYLQHSPAAGRYFGYSYTIPGNVHATVEHLSARRAL